MDVSCDESDVFEVVCKVMSLSSLLEMLLSGRALLGLPCINGELVIYRC